MIGALTMQYNRGRQAAITNELVDIITGTLDFLVHITHLLTTKMQVPVHCKQLPRLFHRHQVVTPVSETNLDFLLLCSCVCVILSKMHDKCVRTRYNVLCTNI